ncbi:cytochrome P450 [Nostoc sp. XA010]|uniref:cytochrome P450 n=1 Tax=Nostoc sp. XA010 TaxID=2780407 RepID=UPI0027E1FCB9|nr:cytochrome P450 [Nostoc sp. XA010]
MATTLVSIPRIPPEPKGHFIIGHIPEFQRDPIGFLSSCARKYGDFVRLRFGLQPVYLINHPDYIEEVLTNKSSHFQKPRIMQGILLGNGLLTSEKSFWHRQRRLTQPAFHRDRISAYGDVMVAYTKRMLAKWQDGEIYDVQQEISHLTLSIVAKTLFDVDVANETEKIVDTMKVLVDSFNARATSLFMLPERIPTPGNLRYLRSVQRLDKIVYSFIKQRRASNEDAGDLLSMLLYAESEDGSQMTDQQLRDEIMTLFIAGYETTANALSWTWMLLSQHPEVESKLIEELQTVLGERSPTVADLPQLPYAEMIISESMRLYPPIWSIAREVVQECEIGGYILPAKTTVFMSQWVMHRDPRFFDRPDVFNPDRWTEDLIKRLPTFAYFPFGGGPRVCIGKRFAIMEMVLLLVTIAQKFRLTMVPGHPIAFPPAALLRPMYGLKMSLTKR